jgi:hypothetical protein
MLSEALDIHKEATLHVDHRAGSKGPHLDRHDGEARIEGLDKVADVQVQIVVLVVGSLLLPDRRLDAFGYLIHSVAPRCQLHAGCRMMI